MGRRRKNRSHNTVYLGKKVKDIGKPGLDTLTEVRSIARAIREDFRSGRITKTLALRRLALLKLAVSRDRDFAGEKEKKALKTIDRYLDRIRKTKTR